MIYQQTQKLKICGITRLEDALLASELGVEALGFVFYEKSPRYIMPRAAQKIIAQLPPFVSVVGLFVNPSQKEIDETLEVCALDVLQFHGDESPELCTAQNRRVIKALPISNAEDLLVIPSYPCSVLLDAKAEKDVYGGTGHSFDWSLLNDLQHDYPLVLAGGINAANIEQAKSITGLYALDVSSGIESDKGIKDAQKMKNLCEKFY